MSFIRGFPKSLPPAGRVFWLAALFFFFGSAAGQALASSKLPKARLGNVTVTLAGPDGLARVDGRRPQADAYVKKTAPKLKFQVMALYADPGEWAAFTAAAAAGRPAAMPRFALLGTTMNMPNKHFDQKSLRQELTRYEKWFSLVAGNRPLAALLTRQGNKKLAEVMGVDIGFEFKVDQFTRKFDQSSDSLSMGAKVGFNIFGQPSQVFLTATAQAVGDKIVYMAYFEKEGQEVKTIQERAKKWRQTVARLNADQYKP